MKKIFRLIALALSLIIIISAISGFIIFAGDNIIPSELLEPGEFRDVPKDSWFYTAVKWAQENGYVYGKSNTEFAPMDSITRADFVTILGRLEKINEKDYLGTYFDDVPTGKYYSTYVKWAAENKIVAGMSETVFNPNGNITREQMAAIIYRYSEYKGRDVSARADLSKFSDANKVSDWAIENMRWANAEGIITGSDIGLEPTRNATRAQVASILMRYCQKYS